MVAVDAFITRDAGLVMREELIFSKKRSGEAAEPHHVTWQTL